MRYMVERAWRTGETVFHTINLSGRYTGDLRLLRNMLLNGYISGEITGRDDFIFRVSGVVVKDDDSDELSFVLTPYYVRDDVSIMEFASYETFESADKRGREVYGEGFYRIWPINY